METSKEDREIIMAEAAEKLARSIVDGYDMDTMTEALVEHEAAAYLKNEEKMLEDWEQQFQDEPFPVDSIVEYTGEPEQPESQNPAQLQEQKICCLLTLRERVTLFRFQEAHWLFESPQAAAQFLRDNHPGVSKFDWLTVFKPGFMDGNGEARLGKVYKISHLPLIGFTVPVVTEKPCLPEKVPEKLVDKSPVTIQAHLLKLALETQATALKQKLAELVDCNMDAEKLTELAKQAEIEPDPQESADYTDSPYVNLKPYVPPSNI